MTTFLVKLITLYQKYLSPDHSFWAKHRFPYGFCRFSPSCSEYTRQALLQQGLLKGLWKSLFRILYCNPFSAGGYDPLTKK